jgi:hypothetical protein
LPQAAFESWGWRVPFLVGIVVGFVGTVLSSYHIHKICGDRYAGEWAREPCHVRAAAGPQARSAVTTPASALRRVSSYIVTAIQIASVGLDAPQCDRICLIEDDASETLANDRKCL